MAKRAAPDEKPYRPLLDAELVSSALQPAAPAARPATAAEANGSAGKILEMPRPDSVRTPGQPTLRGNNVHDRPRLNDDFESPADSVSSVVEKFDHEKRILFTRPETQAIDRLITSLAMRLSAQVKVSHVVRALVALLLNAEAELDRRAGEAGKLVRPANGDALGLARFEREIGRIIGAALRDAGPLR